MGFAIPRSRRAIWSEPLPGLDDNPAARFWLRTLLWLAGGRIASIQGVEHLRRLQGPCVVVANHNQRLEALLLPAVLGFLRAGRLVHFFTDWLVLLYPIIGRIVMLHGPIVVTRKEAKLRILSPLKRRYEDPVPPFERARRLLAAGRAVALFPEGIMNRDRTRLLRGFSGAAQLSLDTGAPVLPVGIRFARDRSLGPIGDLERMEIVFGAPLQPPAAEEGKEFGVTEIRDWHGRVMQALSHLSGKQWAPDNQRTRYVA